MKNNEVHKRISYRHWVLEVIKACGWTKEEDYIYFKRLLIIDNYGMAKTWLSQFGRMSYFKAYITAKSINIKRNK